MLPVRQDERAQVRNARSLNRLGKGKTQATHRGVVLTKQRYAQHKHCRTECPGVALSPHTLPLFERNATMVTVHLG